MNIVISGGRLQVYGEDVQTYKTIPVGSYEVCFHKMMGFYMTSRPDLMAKEDKVYGDHTRKVEKIFRAYENMDRNLGVILSGIKGSGKSLLVRMLAQESIGKGIPVILVNSYVPGIASFLADIDQEVLVVFDEFEKTFGKNDEFDPQEEMLSLFDGLDNGKKLFVVTCNELNKMNNYLLNRPGRFHYHFVIGSPSPAEVQEYMIDKLEPKYYPLVDRIVNFANTVNITYDYLRAIAFEINMGYSIEETLNELNIMRVKDLTFDIMFKFTNGQTYETYGRSIDLYSNEGMWFRAFGGKNMPTTMFRFKPTDVHTVNGVLCIAPANVEHEIDSDEYWELEGDERAAKIAAANARVIESVVLKKVDNSIGRYLV